MSQRMSQLSALRGETAGMPRMWTVNTRVPSCLGALQTIRASLADQEGDAVWFLSPCSARTDFTQQSGREGET